MGIAGRLFVERTPFTTDSPVAQPSRSSKFAPLSPSQPSRLRVCVMMLATLALCACGQPSVAQSLPRDPVEDLRQTLKVVGAGCREREQGLKAAVEQVRNVN